jgi:GrpB-like predicted nucleotidyltransferase (UPF0157 family)
MANEALDERIRRLAAEDIALVPYDARWPEMFRAEKAHLESCLPADLLRRIEHFGSTAIPEICAKPIVDVLVEVTDLEEAKRRIVPVLESQGYEYIWRPTRGDDGPPWYAWFIKREPVSGARTHHIHMVEAHFPQWECLLFRDYLIAHTKVAREYESLKRRLAEEFPNDRIAYTNGKSSFVVDVTNRARQAAEA